MTRMALVAFAAAIALLASPDTADAKRGNSSGSSDAASRDRVSSRDPAGTYRGYPAWAANALSPRGNGGGR